MKREKPMNNSAPLLNFSTVPLNKMRAREPRPYLDKKFPVVQVLLSPPH
jgi:hypothetical protein